MYLLDTNHCSLILNGDEQLVSRMSSLGPAAVATSEIVRGELVYMALNSDRQAINLSNAYAFLHTISILRIDNDIADRFAEIKSAILNRWGPRERAKRRHATIGQLGFTDNDLWLAATASRHGLRLVTSDRDFRRVAKVVDLQVEDWQIPSPAPR